MRLNSGNIMLPEIHIIRISRAAGATESVGRNNIYAQ